MLKQLASFSAFPTARLFPFFHFVSGSLLPFPSISSHLELPLPSIYCFCLHAMIFFLSKIYTQVWCHGKIMGLMSEWLTTVETGGLWMGLEGQPSKDSSGCCATDTSSLRDWAWTVGGQDTQNWFCLLITTTKGFEQTLVVHLIVWKLKTPPVWRWKGQSTGTWKQTAISSAASKSWFVPVVCVLYCADLMLCWPQDLSSVIRCICSIAALVQRESLCSAERVIQYSCVSCVSCLAFLLLHVWRHGINKNHTTSASPNPLHPAGPT